MAHRKTVASVPSLFFQATTAALEMGHDSAVTIGHRMPMLAAMPFWPSFAHALEMQRMVTEKMAAFVEGSLAASQEAAGLTMRAALGRADAAELTSGALSIALAASRPARRRVRANARRLSAK